MFLYCIIGWSGWDIETVVEDKLLDQLLVALGVGWNTWMSLLLSTEATVIGSKG